MAPLMTRRIIKCNERRRFVAFHFNCVGCGSDGAIAVSVDFLGGFCCICIPGMQIKTSVQRRNLYLTTAERWKRKDKEDIVNSSISATQNLLQPLNPEANQLPLSGNWRCCCLLPLETAEKESEMPRNDRPPCQCLAGVG